MNGWSKRSLSPWSAGQDDEASVLSESVEETKMRYNRKREDGSPEKNVILKRIYKDFGCLSKLYKNPDYLTYTKSSFPGPQKRAKAENPSRTANSAKYEPYKPKGTPRYSKIDKFIDNLNQACSALPKPLIEDFGRVRPHTVGIQIQPKGEVRSIRVRGNEPTTADEALCKDSENLKRPVKSGVGTAPGITQMNTCASPEMGPWKIIDQGNSERQAAKPCSDHDAFERKKKAVARAATMLQARYRGYKVRRSQPLKHMLMIGGAKSKLEELKQQFTAWKIAVWFPTDDNERLAMTESITNLLTELEAIQGVPLYIREFRKRVARDVITFQGEVDAFLCHYSKQRHRPLFDRMGKENIHRPKSRTERTTSNCNASGSASLNEPPDRWKTVELTNTLEREFGPAEELAVALGSNQMNSADIGEREESDAEDTVQADQLEPGIICPVCPEEVVKPQEDLPLCRQASVELEVEEENEISHGETNQPHSVGPQAFDIYIPLREDNSRTSKKKKYGVRFEDAVDQIEIDSVIQPCPITEQWLQSPEEDSSCHDAGILKCDDQGNVRPSCSNESRRRELTDIQEQREELYTKAPVRMRVAQNQGCPTTDAGDEAGSREQETQPGCIGILAIPRSTVTVLVQSNESLAENSSDSMEEPSCLDFNGDVNVQGRLKYQSLTDDTRNASVNGFGGFGAATIPTKSRFHNEQSHLRTSPTHGSTLPSDGYINYEGSCNSSGGATSETSEELDKVEEHERNGEVFHSEATWTRVPPLSLEKKQMVALAGDATDLRALLESTRLQTSCGDSQLLCMSSRNALNEKTSYAEADVEAESDVDINGVPEVEDVSCCSDCARPQGHHLFECWKPEVSLGEDELRLRFPCNEYPRELQEGYVHVGRNDAGSRDEYSRPPERAEVCAFDHRELRYAVDPYTSKLRRVRQAAQARTANSDHNRFPEKQEKRGPIAVQHVPRAYAHKTTSCTPSPPDSIRSTAERSYPKSRSQSPYRRASVSEERRVWEPDEVQVPDRKLVSKLADDNNRLKRLLKDVMNWNKAQATAMVSMSERIGQLEGFDSLP